MRSLALECVYSNAAIVSPASPTCARSLARLLARALSNVLALSFSRLSCAFYLPPPSLFLIHARARAHTHTHTHIQVRYCSPDCQRGDWKRHKASCKKK